jgi:curved DNA-binding protein CbpA
MRGNNEEDILQHALSDDMYERLGLTKECSSEDIKRAFRTIAMIYHPDKACSDSQKKEYNTIFQAVSEAYEILSNPDKRKRYDNGENPSAQSEEHKHNTILSIMLQQIVEKLLNTREDLRPRIRPIEILSGTLEQKQENLQERSAHLTKAIRDLQSIQGRLEVTSGDNVYRSVVLSSIGNRTAELEEVKEDIEITVQLRIVLKNYKDTVPEPRQDDEEEDDTGGFKMRKGFTGTMYFTNASNYTTSF